MTLPSRLEDLPGDTAELTLELARRSHEPVAADRARNLAALRSRLGLPAPPGSTAAPPALPQPGATAPLMTSAGLAGARFLGLAPWQQLLAVGAITGARGFWLGLEVSGRLSVPAPAAVTAAPVPPAAATLPGPATLPAATLPAAAAPGVDSPPVAATAPRASNAPARAAKQPALRARAPRPAPPSAAAERSDPSFLAAVQLLSRARRALVRGEAALALALLGELDARFAPELLDEERAATRVLALCASGEQSAALALARSHFRQRAGSIYTRRLEQSCAADALRR